jgi:formylglycine-generating enzyme required for sulfatase activity
MDLAVAERPYGPEAAMGATVLETSAALRRWCTAVRLLCPLLLLGGCAGGAGHGDRDGDTDRDGGIESDGDTGDDTDGDADVAIDRDGDAEDDSGTECEPYADGGSGGEVPGEWVAIPPGTFTMGSPLDEWGDSDEVQHEVTLTRGFELQTTEVTVRQFSELMGYSAPGSRACEDCPVENVSWSEAAAYCNALSCLAGVPRCYDCMHTAWEVTCAPAAEYASPYECPGFRLPTEAEWEYAARSGTTGATYGDLADIAWHEENSDRRAHPVGTLAPSPWGLHDMLGNVYEWCHDWYGDYPDGPVTDPSGATRIGSRVLRGGSYAVFARYVRVALRFGYLPRQRLDGLGFRVSRPAP